MLLKINQDFCKFLNNCKNSQDLLAQLEISVQNEMKEL
jgi:hypothetical protein